ncbi:alpha/beta hydrolase-fold protein [Roseibium aggregatum]|uniref:DUF3327 domain-containing protein n=1 Tax=Roseibium aggregatum TaxID=187304 RepID=A0A939EKA2_9HYPH|nr:alpha/beta hydrolase-fold protein [Roseibium aggregatum]MBN9673254.1 DUF3327 domain-containing protein [Roseibium aggregatum]
MTDGRKFFDVGARDVLRAVLVSTLMFTSIPAQAESASGAAQTLVRGMTEFDWQAEIKKSGDPADLVLDLAPGTYLFARLGKGPEDPTIDLISSEGTFLRRLFEADDERRAFNLIVEGRGDRIRITASDTGTPSQALHIEKIVPPGAWRDGKATSDPLISPRLKALAAKLETPQAIDSFWSEIEKSGTPMLEEGRDGKALVTFLYRGAKHNVRIFGSPSADHDFMYRLADSDVWYRSYELPASTRLAYRLAADIPEVPGTAYENRVAILATAQADPLNRHPWPEEAVDPWRQKSLLELPEAPAQPYAVESLENGPGGTVESFPFKSEALGNSRTVSLYRPVDFDPQDDEAILLVMLDGTAYRTDVDGPGILDRMQAAGVLPQVAAVFISNPDMRARSAELPGSADFARVVAEEIVPLAQEKLGTAAPAARTVIAGSSFGGLAAVRLALAYPETFGNALSLSGSFWWHPRGTPERDQEFTARQVSSMDRQPVRLFLTAGLFEVSREGYGGILTTNRHLRTVLEAKGYDVTLREYAASHGYIYWRGALSDGLIGLFGNKGD